MSILIPEEQSVVRRGAWTYGGEVEAQVWVWRSWTAFATGDYEDDEAVANDRAAPCFYVSWRSPGEPGHFPSGGGPFFS